MAPLGAGRWTPERAWGRYCDSLTKRPLGTKVATGVLGTVLGDGIAQAAAHASRRKIGVPAGGFSFDFVRTLRLCAHAALIGTPINHAWFAFLDRAVFPSRMGHPITVVAKVALDQAIMSPVGLVLFFTALELMEGRGLQHAAMEVRGKFVPTMAANYMLWPAAHMINFKLVPPDQRILYCNCVAVGWICYLSTVAAACGDDDVRQ